MAGLLFHTDRSTGKRLLAVIASGWHFPFHKVRCDSRPHLVFHLLAHREEKTTHVVRLFSLKSVFFYVFEIKKTKSVFFMFFK